MKAPAAGSKSEQACPAIKGSIPNGDFSPGYRLVPAKIADDLAATLDAYLALSRTGAVPVLS
ncbi:hypothetical protein J2X01_002218 [Arthrobacter ginsengisoli]|uniref:Uncharacterized protein n=1 Tax=Arthrobacter ginsengisoli TaxID=1356565 RepID=A0ABU1UCQ1_9MICC|nr:hypothetical protein [Arthrobacter ginsengisoli]MDR7082928.1 hypothetical protein [Arthrobacter ginsengisoli]